MRRQSVDRVAVDCRALLGEGVTWDRASATLIWLDIDRRLLYRLRPDDGHTVTELDRTTSVVVPTAEGRLVAVAGLEVVEMDADGRMGAVIATLPADGDGRANDARCDPFGRLWVGTVDRSGAHRAGLFIVDRAGTVTTALTGRALSNGIDWSPDGSRCYHADSMHRHLTAIDLDESGAPTTSRELARFNAMPDGLSVDAEGGIWVALWDGGAVQRFDPEGRLDREIEVPGGWITSCAFGGPELRTLYITTAATDLDETAHARYPHAGSLFAVELDVAGRGYTPFGADSGP